MLQNNGETRREGYSEAFRLANASAIARADARKAQVREAVRMAASEVLADPTVGAKGLAQALALAGEMLK
jgi:hypothetical protein